jgi:hypothetical protein
MVRAAGNNLGFLPPGADGFTAGDDVVFAQATALDGDVRTLQTGVRSDALTLTYLSALLNVGNAAGRYCRENPADPNCDCTTPDNARAMLGRCLPSFDPSTAAYGDAANSLAQKCAVDAAAAVASLVASSAFAKQ